MRLEVTCQDRVGLAKDILEILEKYEINLKGIDASSLGYLYMQFADLNFDALSELLPRIRKVSGVLDVRTIPFMPSEREHYALKTLLKTLPDAVFAIDAKSRISILNDSALNVLAMAEHEVLDEPINHWVQGFSFGRWLSQSEVLPQATRVSVAGLDYLVEALPVYLPNEEGDSILAGAVVVMKSPERVGQQFNALQAQVAGFEKLIAHSELMQQVIDQLRKFAQIDAPLLLTGETGTGKEVVAQAVHDASLRKEHKFKVVSCAAISGIEELKILFGEVDSQGKLTHGALSQCDGGSLLISQIDELSQEGQGQLLAYMQTGEFQAVNDSSIRKADVRLIFTAKTDLDKLIDANGFRKDLYYRVNQVSCELPPLRLRQQDIVPLAEYFVNHYSKQLNKRANGFSKDCLQVLQEYAWPGNVRQLKNAIFRAVSSANDNASITSELLKLPQYARGYGYLDNDFEGTLDEAVKQFEASILKRLYPSHNSTRKLAKKLGMSHTAIANKLREYQINKG
ncbi:sigma 54-interacting transcriptional regulator [Paraferrimonas haliotis]|uniref:Transcriptional regulator n=1 Tax=Paraferrimonas haliotis TaxID=2013866 RepID=A0AA37WYV5_9GAMM|nr:sigma 54-interacting transcriptional regulator [Paraferrimonas haliotis]GLS84215.1 transcriptional regulator [Paraferrimonas haliotis]